MSTPRALLSELILTSGVFPVRAVSRAERASEHWYSLTYETGDTVYDFVAAKLNWARFKLLLYPLLFPLLKVESHRCRGD